MRKKFMIMTICLAFMAGVTACSSGGKKPEEIVNTEEMTEDKTTSADEFQEEPGSDESQETPADDGTGPAEGKELAEELASIFKTEAENKTELMAIAEKLGVKDVSGYDCAVSEVSEGYLNGFTEEINGFQKGVCISPWIGTIPFVCYVFETENPEDLQAELASKANPRWNICTEALEPVFEIVGNYVFMTMVPNPR